MLYVNVKAKSAEEAIVKSGIKIGQEAHVARLTAHGNTDGNWTVHPEYQLGTYKPKENNGDSTT